MSACTTNNSSLVNEQSKYPPWIQPKLFEELLKSQYNDFEEILEFSVDNALEPGENYATVMLKVEIVLKLKASSLKHVSFMLKISHYSEALEKFMQCQDIFAVETAMFQHIVPEFEKMFADVGINVKFVAKCYELSINIKYVLLENLKVQGFKNTNRLNGLDRKHTESVLKKLAQWHAASAVRVANKGLFSQELCTGFAKPVSYDTVKDMFEANSKPLLECIKEYRYSELYYDKVVKLQYKITDEIFKFAEADPNEFNVLNHGDFWSNNIMFKYDEQGNIVETYFVDLQMTRYGSPAQDLWYFLLSSTKLNIKLKDFDYFIKLYHDHLVESLKQLNYKEATPTLKEIHQMILKYGIYGYMTSTTVMAAVLCDPTNNATLDNFVNDSEDGINFKKQMYSNERFRSHMEEILPWLFYKGLLDC